MAYCSKAALRRSRSSASRESEPSRTALHEAAHAAIAIACGRRVAHADVRGGPPQFPHWHGYVEYERGGGDGNPWNRLLCDVAGEAADLHFFRAEPTVSADYSNALTAASFIADPRDPRRVFDAIREARGVALDFVRANATAIKRLAQALDAVGTMDGASCAEFLGEMAPPPTRAEAERAEEERQARVRYFLERREAETRPTMIRVPVLVRVDGWMGRR